MTEHDECEKMVNPNEIRVDPQLKDLVKPLIDEEAEREDLYKDWAFEILQLIDDQCQLTDYTKETIGKLADKLRLDLESYIIGEWFCSDCDYVGECEK